MIKKTAAFVILFSLALLPEFSIFSGREISLEAQAIGGQDLTPLEKEIVEQINLARINPHEFLKFLESLRPFYHGNMLELPGEFRLETKEGVAALDDAIKYIKSSKLTMVMTVAKGLTRGAREHVKDQQDNPEMSFDGTDGSSPIDRMTRYGKPGSPFGENIGYGALTARGMVALFILSDGFPGRDLRVNLFNPKYKKMGVACGRHQYWEHYCVVDFAGSYIEKIGK